MGLKSDFVVYELHNASDKYVVSTLRALFSEIHSIERTLKAFFRVQWDSLPRGNTVNVFQLANKND